MHNLIFSKEVLVSLINFAELMMNEIEIGMTEEQLKKTEKESLATEMIIMITKSAYALYSKYIDADRIDELVVKAKLDPDIFDDYIIK